MSKVRVARVFTRVIRTRALTLAREPGIKWVAKIGSHLLHRPSCFASFTSSSRPDRVTRLYALCPPFVPPSRLGVRSKEWRTIKRNDTVKERDRRWLRKRPGDRQCRLNDAHSRSYLIAFHTHTPTHLRRRSWTYKWYHLARRIKWIHFEGLNLFSFERNTLSMYRQGNFCKHSASFRTIFAIIIVREI